MTRGNNNWNYRPSNCGFFAWKARLAYSRLLACWLVVIKHSRFSLQRIMVSFVFLGIVLAMFPNYPPLVFSRPIPFHGAAIAWQTAIGGFLGAAVGVLFRQTIVGIIVGLIIGLFSCVLWKLLGFPGEMFDNNGRLIPS